MLSVKQITPLRTTVFSGPVFVRPKRNFGDNNMMKEKQ